MIKVIKKTLLGALSVLGVSMLIWMLLIMNPNWSYANKTEFDYVTVYHNGDLPTEANDVIADAISIIKRSDLFEEGVAIDLCMNDDEFYPKVHPLMKYCLGYGLFDKTILKECDVNFEQRLATTKWEVNNYEFRKFDLVWLLAHEFTHNLQIRRNPGYWIKSTMGHINWKLEGHAEYVSCQFQNDGQLKEKIANFQKQEKMEFVGWPVFDREDGTKQIFSYYKYALIVQYLMEIKALDYDALCALEISEKDAYNEMLLWTGNDLGD